VIFWVLLLPHQWLKIVWFIQELKKKIVVNSLILLLIYMNIPSDWDSYLCHIPPRGPLWIMGSGSGGTWGIITSLWTCHQIWQLRFPISYRLIGTHRLDVSVKTKSHASVPFDRPIARINLWAILIRWCTRLKICSIKIDKYKVHSSIFCTGSWNGHHVHCTLSRKLKRLLDPWEIRRLTRGSTSAPRVWARSNWSDTHYCYVAPFHGI
jgi:hypothetical protein